MAKCNYDSTMKRYQTDHDMFNEKHVSSGKYIDYTLHVPYTPHRKLHNVLINI